MKCEIIRKDEQDIVQVKLHRHLICIHVEDESDAYELEDLLERASKIKVRRYNKNGNTSEVQSDT